MDKKKLVKIKIVENEEHQFDGNSHHSGHMKWMMLLHILPIVILMLLNYYEIEVNNIGRWLIFMIMPLSHIPMMLKHKKC